MDAAFFCMSFNNFFIIDATVRSKISSDQKRFNHEFYTSLRWKPNLTILHFRYFSGLGADKYHNKNEIFSISVMVDGKEYILFQIILFS